MNRKLSLLLAAILLSSAAACQSGTQPAGVSVQSSPASPSGSGESTGGGSAAAPADGKQPMVPQTPDKQNEHDQANPSAGASSASAAEGTQQPAPALKQPAKKLYKMNPKSYDIVPIDPSAPAAGKKIVLLTFDDGPRNKEVLESILNTLDKHNAKAVFFVNGYLVKQKPELLKLIHERGQTIGNHSWDHIDLKKENKDKIGQQIRDVQKIVKDLTGSAPQFFRPPFGSGSDEVRAHVKEEGMLYMTWSNGSLDWEMTVKKNDPEKVVSNVLEQLRGGSNILMHELPWTAQALDKLLTQLEEKQFGFVDPDLIETVTE